MSKPFYGLFLTLAVLLASSSALAQQVCKYDSIPATAPASRFTDNGDGTVTDQATRLQWKRCAEGQSWNGVDQSCIGTATRHTWQQALQLADGATDLGYFDWRLPNVKQLASIVEEACYRPSIDLAVFPDTTPYFFWSASPSTDSYLYAWSVFFDSGYVVGRQKDTDDVNHVRLVRGGE